MKKGYLTIVVIALLISAGAIYFIPPDEKEFEQYSIPKEQVYVGSIVFCEGEPLLVNGENENTEQVKRVNGIYVIRLDKTCLTVEIYSWGTRTLFRRKVYYLSELIEDYPEGVSVWVEQDLTSAAVILVPWQ
ncbi:MAG: hypothetical protein HXS44_15200 [Theionarchaea archaeon]|nr:hypothetical protein [Theionarchaea archaeon]